MAKKTKKQIYEDKVKFFEFTKDIFNALKNRYPGKFDNILTDEKAMEIVDDENRLNRYLRANEVYKKYQDMKNEIESPIHISLKRLSSVILIPEENEDDKKYNKSLIEKANTTLGARDISKNIVKDILDFDYSKLYIDDPTDVIDIFENNLDYCYKSFVINDVLKDTPDSKVNPNVSKFLENNKYVYQAGGSALRGVDHYRTISSLVIPEEIAQEIDTNFMNDYLGVVAKYEHEFEDLNQGFAAEDFSIYIPYVFDIPTFSKNKTIEDEFLEETKCKNFNEFIENYYFVDEKTKKDVPLDIVISNIRDYRDKVKENPDLKKPEYKMVKYNETEKDELANGLTHIYANSIDLDKNLQEKIAKDIYKEYRKNMNIPQETRVKFTDEAAIERLNDKKNIEIHEKARNILKRNSSRDYEYMKLCTSAKVNLKNRIGAYAKTTLDVFDKTKEKENIETIKKLSTRQGEIDLANKLLKDIVNSDFVDVLSKSPEEIINNYDKYKEFVTKTYTLNSIIQNNGYDYPPQLKEILNANMGLIEEGEYLENVLKNYGNELFLLTPDDKEIDKSSNTQTSLSKDINNVRGAYDYQLLNNDFKPGKSLENNLLFCLNKTEMYKTEKYVEELKNLKNENKFDKEFITNNYVTKDGKLSRISDYLKDKFEGKDISGYKIEKYSDNVKNEIKDLCLNNPFHDSKLDFVKSVLNQKDQYVEVINVLNKANAVFRWTNSEQYNNIKRNSTDVLNLLQDNNIEDIEKMPSKEFDTFAKNFVSAFKKYNDSCQAYIDAKQNQSKNTTRLLRFQCCQKLVSAFKNASLDDASKPVDQMLTERASAKEYFLNKDTSIKETEKLQNAILNETNYDKNVQKENTLDKDVERAAKEIDDAIEKGETNITVEL